MPREKDSIRDYVEFRQNNKWKCNFCDKEYGRSVTGIKVHLAGVGGLRIQGCKVVNGELRSEARKAVKDKRPVEPSNGLEGNVQGSSYPHLISSSLAQAPHQPMTVSNEDARRETSFTAMPYRRSDAISTVGETSSAFLPVHETNVPSQSITARNMIPQGDFSFWTRPPQLPSQSIPARNMIPQEDFSFWTLPPQSHAGDSYIQPRNLSHPNSSGGLVPEALTNMPHPMNAEEGEPI